ncbi:MAG: ester cyclase [Cyanobacteriota bacterium]
MNQVSNKSVVRQFFDVYNTKDYAQLSKCMAPDYFDHNLPQVRSLNDAIEILKSTHSAFPDLQVVIDELIEENDLIAFRGRFSGTHAGSFLAHAATGRRVVFSALEIFKIREQKIVESWGYWPTDEILRQLIC